MGGHYLEAHLKAFLDMHPDASFHDTWAMGCKPWPLYGPPAETKALQFLTSALDDAHDTRVLHSVYMNHQVP